jgi:hypothetical protein
MPAGAAPVAAPAVPAVAALVAGASVPAVVAAGAAVPAVVAAGAAVVASDALLSLPQAAATTSRTLAASSEYFFVPMCMVIVLPLWIVTLLCVVCVWVGDWWMDGN